jgi:hypothetical protein
MQSEPEMAAQWLAAIVESSHDAIIGKRRRLDKGK